MLVIDSNTQNLHCMIRKRILPDLTPSGLERLADIGQCKPLFAYLQNSDQMAPCQRKAVDNLRRILMIRYDDTSPTKPDRMHKYQPAGMLQKYSC